MKQTTIPQLVTAFARWPGAALRRCYGALSPALLCAALVSAISWNVRAQSELPSGFGGITVGMPWEEVASAYQSKLLDSSSSALDRFSLECGYRTALVKVENGELLVIANDGVVTNITYITPIQPGSDLMAAADLVMNNYGQPDVASMRDLAGRVTLDRARVNYVTLVYGRKRRVEFKLSGRELWHYEVSIRFEHYRWHENKGLRCAREKERLASDTEVKTKTPASSSN